MLLDDRADGVRKGNEGEDPGTEKPSNPEPSSRPASPYGDYHIPKMALWRIKAIRSKASK